MLYFVFVLPAFFGESIELGNIQRPVGRILEGSDDLSEEFPYVVALISADNYVMKLKDVIVYRGCTGSLISEQCVLTAAHCTGSSLSKIQYGDMTKLPNATDATVSKVLKWIRHHASRKDDIGGVKKRSNNDLGLLLVEKVRIRAYGRLSAVDYSSIMGQGVTYTGFGVTYKSKMNVSEQMKTIAQDQVKHRQIGHAAVIPCKSHKDITAGPTICLAPKCANREQTATLVDSGGPMLFDGKIVGVASLYIDATDFRFTPISPYLDWIQGIMLREFNET